LIAFAFLAACTDNGKKVEAKDAEKVTANTDKAAIVFNQVASESHLNWRAAHLGGVQPRFGRIFLKNAEVAASNGKITNAKVVIDMTSFTVENFEDEDSKNKLTGHLQTDDFFKVGTYPTSKFELTNIAPAQGDFNSTITGNLTILDVTKSITFKANVDVTDQQVKVKSEDFAINRTDWGLTYNVEGTAGVPANYLIANDIGFTIDISLGRAIQ
jgi:polyisoprenoid-binding protein YceI